MCLGVPMRLLSINADQAVAELGGVRRDISLVLVDDCSVGDYVLVHAGFAISRIDDDIADETISLLQEKYGATDVQDQGADS
jgi:hydrogenase expression/formation protein HypC